MPLITTVAELKKYIPVAYTNSDARLPDFNQAEDNILYPSWAMGCTSFSWLHMETTA